MKVGRLCLHVLASEDSGSLTVEGCCRVLAGWLSAAGQVGEFGHRASAATHVVSGRVIALHVARFHRPLALTHRHTYTLVDKLGRFQHKKPEVEIEQRIFI